MTQIQTILVLAPYYLPGYRAGGPIRSLENLVDQLGDEYRFRIVTTDRDLGQSESFPGVTPGRWVAVGAAKVIYLPPRLSSWLICRHIFAETPHDLLYINSVFSVYSSLVPLVLRALGLAGRAPLLIAPRGEFFPPALARRRWKKAPVLAAMRILRLGRRATWHATTPQEAAAITDIIGPADICVAQNLAGSARPLSVDPPEKQPGSLRLVFIGRINPIKNLAFALERLATLAPSGQVVFDIYGELEQVDYWARCQALMARLPSRVKATYCGVLPPDRLAEAIRTYHALFLPTCTENFGHAIAEALMAGLSVLISNRTPWQNLESAGVGYDLPLEQPARFEQALRALLQQDATAAAVARALARAYAHKRLRDPDRLDAYRRIFQHAIQKRM
jgi:glycosyltransferase involved in cell wall biosynthesis